MTPTPSEQFADLADKITPGDALVAFLKAVDAYDTDTISTDGKEELLGCVSYYRHAIATALKAQEENARETFASIIQWGDDTFGPCTAERAISRAGEEWDEMLLPDADVPIEAADVIICLLRIPGIADALQRKMAINRSRRWNLMGDGSGYHIKEPG